MTTVSSASGGARIKPPGEGQAGLSRGAPPARSLVADAHGSGIDGQRGGMAPDLAFDGGPGAGLEPCFEDGTDRPAVGRRDVDDDLVLLRPTDALDARPPRPGPGRNEAEPVEVATEPDRGPIAKSAAGGEDGPLAGLAGQMAAQPRLAVGQERVDVALWIGPAAATGDGHGHDHASLGMDDHAQPARARRATERVRERATRQACHGGRLGRRCRGTRGAATAAPRAPRSLTVAAAGPAVRRSRPRRGSPAGR